MLKCLNDITIDELKEVEKLSALFFCPEEIAEMLEFDEIEFKAACNNTGNDINKHYQGGYYNGQIDLRNGIMKMAKAGSTPAQTMGIELLKQLTLKRNG